MGLPIQDRDAFARAEQENDVYIIAKNRILVRTYPEIRPGDYELRGVLSPDDKTSPILLIFYKKEFSRTDEADIKVVVYEKNQLKPMEIFWDGQKKIWIDREPDSAPDLALNLDESSGRIDYKAHGYTEKWYWHNLTEGSDRVHQAIEILEPIVSSLPNP